MKRRMSRIVRQHDPWHKLPFVNHRNRGARRHPRRRLEPRPFPNEFDVAVRWPLLVQRPYSHSIVPGGLPVMS